jgi:hypothetical protein
MLRSPQVEREIADRIERSIRQLRKTQPADEKARRAQGAGFAAASRRAWRRR